MRYVDLDLLDLPNGWQARADKALNELREEVDEAEANAAAAGEDVSAARRAAITNGLEPGSRQAIWRDLSSKLAHLKGGLCWYTESNNPASDKNVDHFRPKNRVLEDPEHEGYWWKAFEWRNYRYASQWANQRRIDKGNKTTGGKRDHFPLKTDTFRARVETDDIHREIPILLDPADPDDWKLLTFREDGHPTPARSESSFEYERAKVSIEVYHLKSRELVTGRKMIAGRVKRTIEYMESLRPNITDPCVLRLYKRQQSDLLRMMHPHSEYSGAALAYARSQIYKFEYGHEVKREWLEEIINFQ